MNAKQMATGVSLRAAALIGGVGLLLMIVLAIFAYGKVIPSLITPNDAITTVDMGLAVFGLHLLVWVVWHSLLATFPSG